MTLFAISYVVLGARWPLIDRAYAAGFHVIALAFCEASGLVFEAVPYADGTWKCESVLRRTAPGWGALFKYEMRFSHSALAFVAALILATPLETRRKLTALAISVGLVILVLAARFCLGLAHKLTDGPVTLVNPPWVVSNAVAVAYGIMWDSFLYAYITPAIIWVIVVGLRFDLSRMRRHGGP